MEYNSIFEIIGPRMVGPSSSHTAGAARIGGEARALCLGLDLGELTRADIYLYGSFATTYKGHATDVALVGGLIGLDPADLQITQAFTLAKEKNIQIQIIPVENEPIPVDESQPLGENNPHPNTVKIHLHNTKGMLEVVGVSIGGGSFKIIHVQNY